MQFGTKYSETVSPSIVSRLWNHEITWELPPCRRQFLVTLCRELSRNNCGGYLKFQTEHQEKKLKFNVNKRFFKVNSYASRARWCRQGYRETPNGNLGVLGQTKDLKKSRTYRYYHHNPSPLLIPIPFLADNGVRSKISLLGKYFKNAISP